MKIQSFEIVPVKYDLKKPPPTVAYGKWPSFFESVIFKLHTDEGVTGIAEAPVAYYLFGETREHVQRGLSLMGEALKGRDPFKIRENLAFIDRQVLSFHGSISAKYALDIALHDIIGKYLSQPVYRRNGGGYRTEFGMTGHIFYGEPAQMAERSRELVESGYLALEVKCLGHYGSIREDVKRIKAVLKSVSEEILVMADANQSWVHPGITINVLNGEFRGVTNLAMEQPVHYQDITGLAKISQAVDIPIIADESAFSPQMVYNLIKMDAVDIVSLKLPRVGGIHKAMKAVEMCELAGMDVKFDWIHYSRISDTAVCHVAANLQFCHIVAVDAHTNFKEDIVASGGVTIEGGKARIPDNPGLGIEIDDTVIKKCSIT
jgi:L-alanine-DL-glutamate epimerase-like enolase superfamily enzyme